MSPSKISKLHPKNRNRERYDLEAMMASCPELKPFVFLNKHGSQSVDFSSPKAVKILNKSLLNHYYGIKQWDFPDENLCPPIPGRADYIHYMADLIKETSYDVKKTESVITCLDIGTGATCIYPIIGAVEYGWQFIASDISQKSLANAQKILASNPDLSEQIELRHQSNSNHIFKGIIKPNDTIDLTIANPPFHASKAEAVSGAKRKIHNLSGKKGGDPKLNFAGISDELIYDGGEAQFIKNMINESKNYGKQCSWFSTLVSKEANLRGVYKSLELIDAVQIKTIPMATGNKITRVVAWSFRSKV